MIRIVHMEGPDLDPSTQKSYLRITADFELMVSPEDRTEEQNAQVLYEAWCAALTEWNQKQQMNPAP